MAGTNLVPGAYVEDVSMCALVLEDEPVQGDSKLVFESFPSEEGIEENYSVEEYQELGGERMPQPGFVSYRGGNWSPFNLKLIFRAGISSISQAQAQGFNVTEQTPPDLEQLLIDMERKVRWCQALGFPLERSLGPAGQRILARAIANQDQSANLVAEEAISKLRRNDPPIVLVVLGSWYTIRGYVKNPNIKWTGPWHPLTARPYGAEVSLTIQPLMAEYPTWQTIRNIGGSAGYTTQLPGITTGSTVALAAAQAAAQQAQVNQAASATGALAGVTPTGVFSQGA